MNSLTRSIWILIEVKPIRKKANSKLLLMDIHSDMKLKRGIGNRDEFILIFYILILIFSEDLLL